MTAFSFPALITLLLASMAASFLFSGSETGLITANRVRLRHRADEGYWGARLLNRLVARRDETLVAILIGNNLALVVATVATVGLLQKACLAAAWPEHRAARVAQVVTPFLLTPVILYGCEILPKSLFRLRPIRFTSAAAPLLEAFRWVVSPVATVLALGGRALAHRIHGEIEDGGPLVTREEMLTLFTQGEAGGAIETHEREMVEGIIEFGETGAAEVMVPRTQMTLARADSTCGELYDLVERDGHSRIPVYRERVDDVVGIVYVRDLLAGMYEESAPIEAIIRPVLHVPESMRLDDLLHEMQARRRSVAIVVDEHGGTAGLVTLEDLIEEIVGEIHDEYDAGEAPLFRRLPDGSLLVAGTLRLDDAREELGLPVPESDVVETIGGYLVQLQGRIPRSGEVMVVGDLQFQVVAATERAVQRVRVRPAPTAEERRL